MYFRELSRCIIIEFDQPVQIFKGEQKAKVFGELSSAQHKASTVVGQLIKLSYQIYAMHDNLKATIAELIPSEGLPEVIDSYSIWLYTLKVHVHVTQDYTKLFPFFPNC